MHFLGRWTIPMSLALFGCLLVAGAAPADQKPKKADPPRPVDDTQGQLFSKKAEERANTIMMIATTKISMASEVDQGRSCVFKPAMASTALATPAR